MSVQQRIGIHLGLQVALQLKPDVDSRTGVRVAAD